MRIALALVLGSIVAACGHADPPAASATSSSAPAAPPSSEPAPAASAEPSAASKRPLEIFNGCADVVTIAFGDDPKAASKRTIAQSASISDAPRNQDGTQTVSLLDANGAPLVKVAVTRHMKRVEVGRSCRTLDAR
jgi:hypothetical protein